MRSSAPQSARLSPDVRTATAVPANHRHLDCLPDKTAIRHPLSGDFAHESATLRQYLYQSGFGAVAKDFPDWYHERIAARLAVYSAFARVSGIDLESQTAGDDTAKELRPIARKVGVTVDPRYGTYDARNVTVTPFKLPAGLLESTSSASSN